MEQPKIFEDFPTVDCNTCDKYWNDQCDGVTHTPRDCKHYTATRRVVIPARLNELEESLKVTKLYTSLMFVLVGIVLAIMQFGG